MMQRTIAAGSSRRSAPALLAAARIRSGMLPGAVKPGSPALTRGPPAGNDAAPSNSSASESMRPPAVQARWHSLSSQSPPALRRYRMVPSMPRSLVKFASRLASVRTGCLSSTPTRDHVPEEM